MARRYARDPQVDHSLRHSVRDGVAVSVQSGSGENFFNAFAVHLRASTGQIALLASLPPLVGSMAQLFSAWFGRRFANRHDLILLGVRMQAAVWPFILFLPVLLPDHAVAIFLTCAVAYYAAGAMVSPHWNSLMGDLVPERKRGRYFALRNRLGSVTSFAALASAGMVLHLFDGFGLAYLGFMAIFMAAGVGRLVSIWHLARMHEPHPQPPPPAVELAAEGGLWQRVRHSRLVAFSLFFGAMQFAVAIASPFFALYMLRDLHFTYLQFTANAAVSVLFQFLSLSAWGRLSDRFGNRFVLALTGFLVPVVPALWLVSDHPGYLLVAQAFSGASWAGFTLSAGNFLYDLVPAHKRVTYMTYHNVLANAGVFLGALLGGWLAATLPEQLRIGEYLLVLPSTVLWLFFISFLARLAAAACFLPRLREVRAARPVAFGPVLSAGLLPLVAPVRGLAFDLVGRLRTLGNLAR